MPCRNLQIRVSPQVFVHEPLLEFVGLSEFAISWIDFSEKHFDSSEEFSQKRVRCG